MPLYNARGDRFAGWGTAPLSINRAPIGRIGGRGDWVTDDQVVFTVCDPQCRSLEYDLRTGGLREILPGGANFLFAGGGRWAAFRNDGLRLSTGEYFPAAGVGVVAPDGDVLYNTAYQQGGPWVRRTWGGLETPVTPWIDDSPYGPQLHALADGVAIWSWQGRLATSGLSTPVQIGPAGRPRLARWQGIWWVSYWTPAWGVVAHPIDATIGHQIVPPGGLAYAHDLCALPDGLHLCYATGAGEYPQEIVDLPQAQWGPLQQLQQPEVAPFGPCWVGYFFEKSVRYGSTTQPSNCTVVVEAGLAHTFGSPVILSPHADSPPQADLIQEYAPTWDRVVAIYCAAEASGTPAALQQVVDQARERMRQLQLPVRPCLAYASTAFWPEVDAEGWVAECYQRADETLEQAQRRWGRQIAQIDAAGRVLAIASADYDRAGQLSEQQVLDAQPIYADLATRADYLLRFAYARPGGTQDHPVWKPWHHAVADAALTPEIPSMTPPKATISSYTPHAGTAPLTVRAIWQMSPGSGPITTVQWLVRRLGAHDWIVAATNPAADPDHHYAFGDAGDYEIGLIAIGPGGRDQTATQRLVRVEGAPTPPDPTPPEPQPPDLSQTWRTIAPECFVAAEPPSPTFPSGALIANREEAHAWEQFVVEPSATQPGRVQIRTVHGTYVKAEEGGGGTVTAANTNPDIWESFLREPFGDGVSLKCWDHAHYLTTGPDRRIVATSHSPEAFQLGPAGSTLLPLRVEQGRFRTDLGWEVPRHYSVFHAVALVRDGNLGELRRLLQRAHAARCNGIRVFGSWYYIGHGMAPYAMTDPAWLGWMDTVLREAASYGLRVELSYFCDAQVLVPVANDRIVWIERLARWALDKPSLICSVANEARKNGWSEADDPALLDLVRRFRAINPSTLIGASDPLDAGAESTSAAEYNARQQRIAQAGVSFLLVHADRKARYAWVDHLKGAAETPAAVGFPGICWHEEPMGGASVDVAGRRDSSPIAHIAAACVGAMTGAYTYMHRQLEDDVCPGLLDSGIAAEIPGSPDYRFINATLSGSPVAAFTAFDKCRTTSNGVHGWAVAYGPHEGALTYASGWHELRRFRWQDGTGTCLLVELSR